MPGMKKISAVRARSLKDIGKLLANTGKKFADGNVDDLVKGMYSDGGSGSIFFDLASGLSKKILPFGGKKIPIRRSGITGRTKFRRVGTVGSKVKDSLGAALNKYKASATDFDIRAGDYVSNKLKNTFAKNTFIDTKKFKVNDTFKGMPSEFLEIEIPRLTTPIDKAKKVVLPFAGAMAISSSIEKKIDKEKKGGEAMKNALNRDELIEKIAGVVAEKNIQIVVNDSGEIIEQFKKLSCLAGKATEMLKMASAENKKDKEFIEKISAENKKLKLEVMAKTRSGKAVKLADTMHQKGLIKKAEVNDKIDEIMDMSEDAYDILFDTVDKIVFKQASLDGIDSLQYISHDSSSGEAKRNTFQDEIVNTSKSIN